MKPEIDKTKLEELHTHIKANKDIDRKGIEKYLGEDPAPWIDALKAAYPETYDTGEETPAPKRGRPPAAKEPTKYFIVENGIKIELALLAEKNGNIILERIEPKDLVTIKLKGEDVTIDLLKLEAESVRYGVPVATLKVLGDIAKA